MTVTSTFRSLDEVGGALSAQLGSNQLSFGSICTRVLLRTGANLKKPRPDQNADVPTITKVLVALADMGHKF